MTTNCPRCGYILLSEGAPCPNCVRMHEMSVKLREPDSGIRGQHRSKARPQRATAKKAAQYQAYEPPTYQNPPGMRWSQRDGRWVDAKEYDRADAKAAAGMTMFFALAFIIVGLMMGSSGIGVFFDFIGIAVLALGVSISVKADRR